MSKKENKGNIDVFLKTYSKDPNHNEVISKKIAKRKKEEKGIFALEKYMSPILMKLLEKDSITSAEIAYRCYYSQIFEDVIPGKRLNSDIYRKKLYPVYFKALEEIKNLGCKMTLFARSELNRQIKILENSKPTQKPKVIIQKVEIQKLEYNHCKKKETNMLLN